MARVLIRVKSIKIMFLLPIIGFCLTCFLACVSSENQINQACFVQAVEQNNMNQARACLAGVRINALNQQEQTPLMIAIFNNNPEMVRFLLQNKAKPLIQDPNLQWNAFFYVCSVGNPALWKLLMHFYPQKLQTLVSWHDSQGARLDQVALMSGHWAFWQFLKSMGFPVLKADLKSRPTLYYALLAHQQTILDNILKQYRLAHTKLAQIQDKQGNNALFLSIAAANAGALEQFLTQLPINGKNHQKLTPLLYAIMTHQYSLCQILLNHHARTTITTAEGQTPLMLAVKNNNFPLIKVLSVYPQALEGKDKNGKTLLDYINRYSSAGIKKYFHIH